MFQRDDDNNIALMRGVQWQSLRGGGLFRLLHYGPEVPGEWMRKLLTKMGLILQNLTLSYWVHQSKSIDRGFYCSSILTSKCWLGRATSRKLLLELVLHFSLFLATRVEQLQITSTFKLAKAKIYAKALSSYFTKSLTTRGIHTQPPCYKLHIQENLVKSINWTLPLVRVRE